MNAISQSWTKAKAPLVQELYLKFHPSSHYIQEKQNNNQLLLSNNEISIPITNILHQLANHKFLDCNPQQIRLEMNEMINKLAVLSYSKHSKRLEILAKNCDYKVLKLLIELSQSFNNFDENQLKIGLINIYDHQNVREKEKKIENKELKEWVRELKDIAVKDDWFEQDWTDEDMWEDIQEEEIKDLDEDHKGFYLQRNSRKPYMSKRRDLSGVKRSNQSLSPYSDLSEQNQVINAVISEENLIDVYYKGVTYSKNIKQLESQTSSLLIKEEVDQNENVIDCPSMLFNALNSRLSDKNASINILPESDVIKCIFQAYHGIESQIFTLANTGCIEDCDFTSILPNRVFQVKNPLPVAVSHLSIGSLSKMLEYFAISASDVVFIRETVAFLRQEIVNGTYRSCTLEGFVSSIGELSRNFQQSFIHIEEGQQILQNDATCTLLALYTRLQPLVSLIKLFKSINLAVLKSIHELKQSTKGCSAAILTKCVLDTIVDKLTMETIDSDSSDPFDFKYSCGEMLLKIFVDSLTPYLDMLDRVLFDDSMQVANRIDPECFFQSVKQKNLHPSKFSNGFLATYKINIEVVPDMFKTHLDILKEGSISLELRDYIVKQILYRNDANNTHKNTAMISQLFLEDIRNLLLQKQPSYLSFAQLIEQCVHTHVNQKCEDLRNFTTNLYRKELHVLKFLNVVQNVVLMSQQDVFTKLSAKILQAMIKNPFSWANPVGLPIIYSEIVAQYGDYNFTFSDPSLLAFIRLKVSIELPWQEEEAPIIGLDIHNMECISFNFQFPPMYQALELIFTSSIMEKYSKLSVFLMQVKAVDLCLLKWKTSIRRSATFIKFECEMRHIIIEVAEMCHYIQCILTYLTQQLSSDLWYQTMESVKSSETIINMHDAIDAYTNELMLRFFLVDKHVPVIKLILSTFNSILQYVCTVTDLFDTLKRKTDNEAQLMLSVNQNLDETSTSPSTTSNYSFHDKAFNVWHKNLVRHGKEFKRQCRFLIVMLSAMESRRASSYVSVFLEQLNFNRFYK